MVSGDLLPHVNPLMNYWRAQGGSSHLSSCQPEKTDDDKFALRLWNFVYYFKSSFPKSVFPPESPDWTRTSILFFFYSSLNYDWWSVCSSRFICLFLCCAGLVKLGHIVWRTSALPGFSSGSLQLCLRSLWFMSPPWQTDGLTCCLIAYWLQPHRQELPPSADRRVDIIIRWLRPLRTSFSHLKQGSVAMVGHHFLSYFKFSGIPQPGTGWRGPYCCIANAVDRLPGLQVSHNFNKIMILNALHYMHYLCSPSAFLVATFYYLMLTFGPGWISSMTEAVLASYWQSGKHYVHSL